VVLECKSNYEDFKHDGQKFFRRSPAVLLTHGINDPRVNPWNKLHKRWMRRIDIYMGNDVKAAKEWGKREVTIRW